LPPMLEKRRTTEFVFVSAIASVLKVRVSAREYRCQQVIEKVLTRPNTRYGYLHHPTRVNKSSI
jgi:hypothetical protein